MCLSAEPQAGRRWVDFVAVVDQVMVVFQKWRYHSYGFDLQEAISIYIHV